MLIYTSLNSDINPVSRRKAMAAADQTSEKWFNHLISAGVTLVDFNAPWCKPCLAQEPIIKALQKDYNEAVKVATLNIDENQKIALNIGIQSIPTIIIYRDGREINRFIGLQTAETLHSALQDAIHQSRVNRSR
jgi:thioredoxin 1